jgi:elongation factor P
MSMLEYNEIREGKVIIHEDEPWVVISSHVFRKQQRKPVNATKLKNLLSGRMVEMSFQATDKVDQADLEKRTVKYLYSAKGECWFSEIKDSSTRFSMKNETIGDKIKFMKENSEVDFVTFENDDGEEVIVSVDIPVKVDLKVVEAPPSVKGNTAQGGNKQVKLETGAMVNVPLFIQEGEVIRVNTETGEYYERVQK